MYIYNIYIYIVCMYVYIYIHMHTYIYIHIYIYIITHISLTCCIEQARYGHPLESTGFTLGRLGPNLKPGKVHIYVINCSRNGLNTTQHPTSLDYRTEPDLPTNVQAVSRASITYTRTVPGSRLGPDLPNPPLKLVNHFQLLPGPGPSFRERA